MFHSKFNTEIVMTCLEFVRGISAFYIIFSEAVCHEEAIYTILHHKDSVLE